MRSIHRFESVMKLAIVLLFLCLWSCSGKSEEQQKRGAIEEPDLSVRISSVGLAPDPDRPLPEPEARAVSNPIGAINSVGVEVNRFGQASYGIPLKVPPGRRGMEPKLLLSYSSSNPNGLLGVGWKLYGTTSEIHRCNRTLIRDGFARPVRADDEDALCFNGQRLILVGGVPFEDGAEYRTEQESFVKVVYSDVGLGGSFEAYFRNGTVEYFGGVNNLIRWNKDHPVGWLRGISQDLHGNRISYRFEHDLNDLDGSDYWEDGGSNYLPNHDRSDSHIRIQSIEYTIHVSPERRLDGGKEIRFLYEERPDLMFGFASGRRLSKNKRLKVIEMHEIESPEREGGLIREYRLDYEHEERSNVSRVVKVTECDGRGDCKLPTRFDWTNDTIQPVQEDTSAGDLFGDEPQVLSGKPEADPVSGSPGVCDEFFYEEEGGRFWEAREREQWIGASYAPFNPIVMDATGDGKTDIVYVEDGFWTILSDDGSASGKKVQTSIPAFPHQLAEPIDFDSDGRDDLLLMNAYGYKYSDDSPVEYEHWHVLRSTGTDFEWVNTHVDTASSPTPGADRIATAQYPDSPHEFEYVPGMIYFDRHHLTYACRPDNVELRGTSEWGNLDAFYTKVADFDGDGVKDILSCFDGEKERVNPDQTVETQRGWWGLRLGFRGGLSWEAEARDLELRETCQNIPDVVDVDGDGAADLVFQDTARGEIQQGVVHYFVHGGSLSAVSLRGSEVETYELGISWSNVREDYWSDANVPEGETKYERKDSVARKWIDINGDGLRDLLLYFGDDALKDTDSPRRFYAWINTADGFLPSAFETEPVSKVTRDQDEYDLEGFLAFEFDSRYWIDPIMFSHAQVIDFNLDGREDLMVPVFDRERPHSSVSYRWVVLVSNGIEPTRDVYDSAIAVTPQLLFDKVELSGEVKYQSNHPDEDFFSDGYPRPRMLDFDGDGASDLLVVHDSSPECIVYQRDGVDCSEADSGDRLIYTYDGVFKLYKYQGVDLELRNLLSTVSEAWETSSPPTWGVEYGNTARSNNAASTTKSDSDSYGVVEGGVFKVKWDEDTLYHLGSGYSSCEGIGSRRSTVACSQVPRVVVSKTKKYTYASDSAFSNASLVSRDISYSYLDFFYDRAGRRALGYRGVKSIDGDSSSLDNKEVRTFAYHPRTHEVAEGHPNGNIDQCYSMLSYRSWFDYGVSPLAGIEHSRHTLEHDSGGNVYYSKAENYFGCRTFNNSKTYLPRLLDEVTVVHLLGPGDLEPTAGNQISVNASRRGTMDQYGNVSTLARYNGHVPFGDMNGGGPTNTQPYSWKTKTRQFSNLTSSGLWVLGLVTESDTEVGWIDETGQSHKEKGVHVSREYALDTGRLIRESLQPDQEAYLDRDDGTCKLRQIPEGEESHLLQRRLEYDDFGMMTASEVVDENGELRRTEFVYDEVDHAFVVARRNPLGHVVRQVVDRWFGIPVVQSDPNGLMTVTELDGFGRVVGGVGPRGKTATIGFSKLLPTASSKWKVRVERDGEPWSEAFIDHFGRLVEVRSPWHKPETSTTETVVRRHSFDDRGRVKAITLPYFQGGPQNGEATYEYDVLGNIKEYETPDGRSMRSMRGLSSQGVRVSTTDPKGNESVIFQNRLGQVSLAIDRMGGETSYSYYADGSVQAVEDPEGNLFKFLRDDYGRVVRSDNPNSGQECYFHNTFGELEQRLDARGNVVNFQYDKLSRMIERDDGSRIDSWAYDAVWNGMLSSSTSSLNEGNAQYQYQSGLLSTIAKEIGGETYETSFAYDQWDRLESIRYPQVLNSSFAVEYAYTDTGHVHEVREANGALLWVGEDANAFGFFQQEYFGNGASTNSAFDPLNGRLDESASLFPGGESLTFNYRYDENDNLIGRLVTELGKGEEFAYDKLDRLVDVRLCQDGLNFCGSQYGFEYDAVGNIKTRSNLGEYIYDDPNHSHAVSRIETSNGVLAYRYDASGNVTRRPFWEFDVEQRPQIVHDWQIEYDTRNKPLYYEKIQTGEQVQFSYDPQGARVKKTSGTQEVRYLGRLFQHKLDTKEQTDELKYNVFVGGKPISILTREFARGGLVQEKTEYAHVDHQNTIYALSDSQGVRKFSYDALGKPRPFEWFAETAVTQNIDAISGFTGHEMEAWSDEQGLETGVINMGGRVYDPTIGKFLSVNPWELTRFDISQDLNAYSYVLNNPLSMVDPSGYQAEENQTPPDAEPEQQDDLEPPHSEYQEEAQAPGFWASLQETLHNVFTPTDQPGPGHSSGAEGQSGFRGRLGGWWSGRSKGSHSGTNQGDQGSFFSWNTLSGAAMVLGGAVEVFVGSAAVVTPEVGSTILGIIVVGHGFDNMLAGLETIRLGEQQFTLTHMGSSAAASTLGADDDTAQSIGLLVDIAASFLSGAVVVKGGVGSISQSAAKLGSRVCSFTAGTLVLMCDGSYKAIEDIEEGDWVLSRDENGDEYACKQAIMPYSNPERSIIILELEDERGYAEFIETTDNHPFFVEGRGWTRVDEINILDQIPDSTGGILTVKGAEWTDRIETVYNFGVSDFHTYFVGEFGAWVHNCDGVPVWVSREVWGALTVKVGPQDAKKFKSLVKRGVNNPTGKGGRMVPWAAKKNEPGVKKLIGEEVEYELKIMGSATRLGGNMNSDGVIVFDKIKHGGWH